MNNPTSMSNIEAVLGQIRNYQAQAQDSTQKTALGMNAVNRDSVGFGDAIKGAIQEVNSRRWNRRHCERHMSTVKTFH